MSTENEQKDNDDGMSVKQKSDMVSELSSFNRDLTDNPEEQGGSLWLITFTDIMALMLTFFVLLYSMSVPEQEKWEEIVSSLNEGLSEFYSPPQNAGFQDTISIEKIDRNEALNLDYLRNIISKSMEKNEKLANVRLISQNNHLIISLPEDLLFDPGDTSVSTNGKRAIFELGSLLSRIRNRIEVVGHADPTPISQGGEFSSNWDLSLARAVEVSGVLKQIGYRRDIIVRGASSARYDELPLQLGEEKRLDLARRVDIVVMSDDGRVRSSLSFE